MPTLINKLNNIKITAILTAAFSVLSLNAYAQAPVDDVDAGTTSIELINNTINNSSSGITIPNVDLSGIPEGSTYEYSYTKSDEGISGSAYASFRDGIDFSSEYINTSSENVTVLNVSAGFNGGASLGCNGLDFGLEALFEFDVGDILDYLPKYILTNLATEALAQIYATPLVSTVMDGLKSMQNFTSEFKQASCDMAAVESRANDIKNARIDECVQKKTKNGQATDAALSDCQDPYTLEKEIKEFKNRVAERETSGRSIGRLLTDNGIPYGSPTKDANGDININQEGYIGSGITKGSLMQMFIPNIKASVNGGAVEDIDANAKINVGQIYKKAFSQSYNAISGIYKSITSSIVDKDIIDTADTFKIISFVDAYTKRIMSYGSRDVFTDTEANNTNKYTSEQIKDIEGQFKDYHLIRTRSIDTESGVKEFKVGPENGIDAIISESDSDLIGRSNELILSAGENCFAKVYEKPSDTDSNYSWNAVHYTDKAVMSIAKIEGDNINDSLVYRLAECKSIAATNNKLIHHIMNVNEELATAYLEYFASKIAYETTTGIVSIFNNSLTQTLNKAPEILRAQCEKTGADKLPAEAYYAEDGDNQVFKNCDDYVEQTKIGEDKLNYYSELKLEIAREADNLSSKVDIARQKFDILKDIHNYNTIVN